MKVIDIDNAEYTTATLMHPKVKQSYNRKLNVCALLQQIFVAEAYTQETVHKVYKTQAQ